MKAAAIAAKAVGTQPSRKKMTQPDHVRPHPPSTGTSVVPSISEEHASDKSQEEYSDNDGFIYHRENASRHWHRNRDA